MANKMSKVSRKTEDSKNSRKTKDSKTFRKTKESKTSPKTRPAPELPLAAADQRALEKLVGKLVQDTKALRRRPARGGFRKINAIIVQDPDNPDQVSICFDIAIPRDDGTFLAWCVCTGAGGTTISSGPCPRGSRLSGSKVVPGAPRGLLLPPDSRAAAARRDGVVPRNSVYTKMRTLYPPPFTGR